MFSFKYFTELKNETDNISSRIEEKISIAVPLSGDMAPNREEDGWNYLYC